ncbi:nucleopolyhedrovirus P10 family protein [Streptomyces sp. NBC_00237]|uniref:nucleopolyhedrovirus P10 family protein n=1 Tax=Streptomyces sp. NBC_00237 TaxID=2975687 RepID=UPI00225270CF|nr:nucleopolyhedrovirus P10 family protein [Streptomyces sp. NBC_00237]MCX5202043.1 nucleopolyhedrovirus P10 family protein [Streptomyces sp. NBC_00237]
MADTASSSPGGGWQQAVRRRLGPGRLLPLGSPADGSWLAERAADTVLRRAAADVRGVALGALRVGLADPDAPPAAPAVPPPPGALPPGPLRVEAEFEAALGEPVPYAARRLRTALFEAAEERLGLAVTEVDLRVTGLLGEAGRAGAPGAPGDVPEEDVREKADPAGPPGRHDSPEAAAERAAAAVPGVLRLTDVLGAPVHYDGTALPGGHVRVEVAVSGERRAREVALEVRAAVADAVAGAAAGRPSVAVLVTEVHEAGRPDAARGGGTV